MTTTDTEDGHGVDAPTEESSGDHADQTAESAEESSMTGFDALVTVAGGLVAGIGFVGLAILLDLPVSLAVVLTAPVAAGIAFFASTPRFAGAGAVYFLSAAVLISVFDGRLPTEFVADARLAFTFFGAISLVIVIIIETVALGIKASVNHFADEEYASTVWRFLSAASGLLFVIWTFITAWEKAVRYGGAAAGGSALFVADLLGYELPFWLPVLGRLDLVVLLFTGCAVTGFHALDTAYNAWYTAKYTAKGSLKAGKKAADSAKTVAETDTVDDRSTE